MEKSSLIAPCSWQWQSGATRYNLQYLPGGGELPATLIWLEEACPNDGEVGHGSPVETTQTLSDFLEEGPAQPAPVDIVEGLLTHVQAQDPDWLEAYRLQHPLCTQDNTAGKEVLERCADTCSKTAWSFLGEFAAALLIEGATHLLDS